MKWTPLHLEILLHYLCSRGQDVEFLDTNATRREFVGQLAAVGLLGQVSDPPAFTFGTGGIAGAPAQFAALPKWAITDRGRVWMDAILSTPLPEQRWVVALSRCDRMLVLATGHTQCVLRAGHPEGCASAG